MADSSPTHANFIDESTIAFDDDARLTPLEAQILTEYARLKANLDTLAQELGALASLPSTAIADNLRQLERKTNVVCTALKASVYSIMLQAEIDGPGAGAGASSGGRDGRAGDLGDGEEGEDDTLLGR